MQLKALLSSSLPNDFGPIYAETNLSNLIAEPWNTFSNIIFLAIFVYWTKKTAFDFKRFPFLVVALIVLFTGFVGGTVYHATRSHNVWLFLDFIPIGILAFITALRLWSDVLRSKVFAVVATILIIVIPRLIAEPFFSEVNHRILAGYASLALSILTPAYLSAYLNNWKNLGYINLAVVSFIIALAFRTYDQQLSAYLPMGSHFLWHIFGGVSVHFLIMYIYSMSLNPSKKTN